MLGDRIKELRLSLGLNQAEFAKRLYVTPGAVSQWEKGATRPDTDRLIKIAVEFNVPLGSLVDVQDERIAQETGEQEIKDRRIVTRITKTEERFLNDFRSLNKEGQKYMMQTIAMAKLSYGKSDSAADVGIA